MHVVDTARFSVFSLTGKGGAEDIMSDKWSSKWLSDRLYAASRGGHSIDFSSYAVKQVLEPHLVVCREQREKALAARTSSITAEWIQAVLGTAAEEAIGKFDTSVYPLRELFAAALFRDSRDNDNDNDDATADTGTTLEQLHRINGGHQGRGKRNDREEKRRLLQPMTDAGRRAIFQGGFDAFVLGHILPDMASHLPNECEEDVLYYQAFPCIRVVRPGEFSIGVHADVNYGFSPANVNYYVGLTGVYGTNSIAVESRPGREDFKVASLEYGDIYRFHGAMCAHLTMENTTATTRVSLDFRVIAGSLWDGGDMEHSDHYSKTKGYYVRAERREKGGGWTRVEPLPVPDARNGFPFTNK